MVAEKWLRRIAGEWFFMIAVSTVMLGMLAKVGEDVLEHESTGFDGAVRGWIMAHQNRAVYNVFTLITWLGSPGPVIAGACLVAIWLWRSRGRQLAAIVAAAAVVATGIFLVIKQWFHRVRPPGAILLHMSTYSFPSGHATTSAALFPTVAFVLVRERMLSRGVAITLAILGPLLIGMSRLYLDVHWATDVLGGWAAGLFVAALAAALYERIRKHVHTAAASGVGGMDGAPLQ